MTCVEIYESPLTTTAVGITQYTQKGHIARATIEATCFQTKAILDAMEKDSGHALSELAVDGGMSNSDLAMQVRGPFFPSTTQHVRLVSKESKLKNPQQTQADLISIPVYRPKMRETTALGAAIAAGLAAGLWRNFAELRNINRAGGTVFEPKISPEESARRFANWEKAVRMSKGWVDAEKDKQQPQTVPKKIENININTALKPVRKPTTTFLNANGHHLRGSSLGISNGNGNRNGYLNGNVSSNGNIFDVFFNDLDSADEEDLLLELRKIEIQKRLKKHRAGYV